MKFTTKWSRTITITLGLALVGAVFGVTAIWRPFAYVLLGAFALYLFVDAIIKDRKDRKRTR